MRIADVKLPCPFVYASGRKCPGHVNRVRAYGPIDGEGGLRVVKKYGLWCSEKDDHAGVVSGWVAKERMEFYPDNLPSGYEHHLRDPRTSSRSR